MGARLFAVSTMTVILFGTTWALVASGWGMAALLLLRLRNAQREKMAFEEEARVRRAEAEELRARQTPPPAPPAAPPRQALFRRPKSGRFPPAT